MNPPVQRPRTTSSTSHQSSLTSPGTEKRQLCRCPNLAITIRWTSSDTEIKIITRQRNNKTYQLEISVKQERPIIWRPNFRRWVGSLEVLKPRWPPGELCLWKKSTQSLHHHNKSLTWCERRDLMLSCKTFMPIMTLRRIMCRSNRVW